jgi:glycosyltransferase involved in cell wall biosynthesis
VHDAALSCDVIHVNNVAGLAFSRWLSQPVVYTVHHPREEKLRDFYSHLPNVHYVCISESQRKEQEIPNSTTIHHGIDTGLCPVQEKKQDYLSFLGRIAPVKGVHLAIEVAKKSGLPLKIAGEIQPIFQEYYEREVKPHIDGKFIEFVGEANREQKIELLGNSRAMLFPLQWNEPFGLVMTEAMACGTPVLALPGGSVQEIVKDGVSGYICRDVEEMAARAIDLKIPARIVRGYVEENFSLERMVTAYKNLYEKTLSDASEFKSESSEPESTAA